MAKKNPAGIFLIIIAVIAVVVGLSKVMLSVFDKEAMQLAFIPSHPISEEVMPPAPDYTKDEAWVEVPEILAAPVSNATIKEVLEAIEKQPSTSAESRLPRKNDTAVLPIDSTNHFRRFSNPYYDVFFIHPTTHMKPTAWNAAYDDASALPMLESVVLKNMVNAFGSDAAIYAPRYRQATTGAFYDDSGQGDIAKERAYQDILAAYDNFMIRRDKRRPFTLVGHSQGALHLLNLLKDRVANSPARDHLVAAYIIGWPVSIEEDLESIGMKACENAEETGCVISWMTFAGGADTSDLKTWYNASLGLSGKPRVGSTQLCTNPLTWTINSEADASLNLGSVVLTPGDAPLPVPIEGLTGAVCEDGFLFVSPSLGDEWRVMDLGGGNLHWYDINLFYMNIRTKADAKSGITMKVYE